MNIPFLLRVIQNLNEKKYNWADTQFIFSDA